MFTLENITFSCMLQHIFDVSSFNLINTINRHLLIDYQNMLMVAALGYILREFNLDTVFLVLIKNTVSKLNFGQ
jgi:hypothetical protein